MFIVLLVLTFWNKILCTVCDNDPFTVLLVDLWTKLILTKFWLARNQNDWNLIQISMIGVFMALFWIIYREEHVTLCQEIVKFYAKS